MNIAILSRNPSLYSTQSLVKAARQRHHYVRVLDYVNCDIIINTDDVHMQYYGQRIKNIDAIIPRIGSSVTEYGASVIRQFEASIPPRQRGNNVGRPPSWSRNNSSPAEEIADHSAGAKRWSSRKRISKRIRNPRS